LALDPKPPDAINGAGLCMREELMAMAVWMSVKQELFHGR
jgi:hypothetical protein